MMNIEPMSLCLFIAYRPQGSCKQRTMELAPIAEAQPSLAPFWLQSYKIFLINITVCSYLLYIIRRNEQETSDFNLSPKGSSPRRTSREEDDAFPDATIHAPYGGTCGYSPAFLSSATCARSRQLSSPYPVYEYGRGFHFPSQQKAS